MECGFRGIVCRVVECGFRRVVCASYGGGVCKDMLWNLSIIKIVCGVFGLIV